MVFSHPLRGLALSVVGSLLSLSFSSLSGGEIPEPSLPGGAVVKRPDNSLGSFPYSVPPPVRLGPPFLAEEDLRVKDAQERVTESASDRRFRLSLKQYHASFFTNQESLLSFLAPLRKEFPEDPYFWVLEAEAHAQLGNEELAMEGFLSLFEFGSTTSAADSPSDPKCLLPESVQTFLRFNDKNATRISLVGHWQRWSSASSKHSRDRPELIYEAIALRLLYRRPLMTEAMGKRFDEALRGWGITRPDLLSLVYNRQRGKNSFDISTELICADPEDDFLGMLWLYGGMERVDPHVETLSNWNEGLAQNTFERLSKRRPQITALLGLLAAVYLPEPQVFMDDVFTILEKTEHPHEDLVEGVILAILLNSPEMPLSTIPNHLSAAQKEKLVQQLVAWIPDLVQTERLKWPRLRKPIVTICQKYNVPELRFLGLVNQIKWEEKKSRSEAKS